jgi:hypothetical protein
LCAIAENYIATYIDIPAVIILLVFLSAPMTCKNEKLLNTTSAKAKNPVQTGSPFGQDFRKEIDL